MPMTMSEAGKLGALKSLKTIKENKRERIEEYLKNPEKCHNCNKIINYESYILKKSAYKQGKIKKIFCSSSCSAKHSNKNRTSTILACKKCGKETSNKREFCCYECLREFQWNINLESINREGKLSDGSSQATIRKFLLKTRPRKCDICKLDNWFGRPLPVVADHINGNPYDHRLENLRFVCGNCNMELETYTGKNRGNGRYSRRQRYKEGKSC